MAKEPPNPFPHIAAVVEALASAEAANKKPEKSPAEKAKEHENPRPPKIAAIKRQQAKARSFDR